MKNCLAVILAGGKGTRLDPLTRDRAKPAVPFGGAYRIIDFVLSNCLNSGLRKLLVLTQYKAFSLDRHISAAWSPYFSRDLGEFLDISPPQHQLDEHWYLGTADAVYQNIFAIEQERPEHVVVLAGDHIYKMNYGPMVDFHIRQEADLTIGALTVPKDEGTRFGVMQVNPHQRVIGFEEKPREPKCLPDQPDDCLASMGIYVFRTEFLFEQLCRDAGDSNSSHDFGKDIIPSVVDNCDVYAYPFRDENGKEQAYWRDVGTIGALYHANMDLIAVEPELNLYDREWPIRTRRPNLPPPKFVFSGDESSGHCGKAIDSMVGLGSIISGGSVQRSVIGRNVRVEGHASVEDSILFDDVKVGHGSQLRRAIVESGVTIPDRVHIGFDPELDAKRGITWTNEGIAVVRNDLEWQPPPRPASQNIAGTVSAT